MIMKKFDSVDAYLAALPPQQAAALARLRNWIIAAAPGVEERISYGMPGYYLHGPLVYFAAFKNHCSFFAGSATFLQEYAKDLEGFHTSRSTIHFTPEHPLPAALVKKMVRQRVQMNRHRTEEKKKGSTTRPARAKRNA